MKIVNEKPPIYDQLVAYGFGFDPGGTVFTYGDTLYNPAGIAIPDHLLVHEEVHAGQQGHSEKVAKDWWGRYVVDPYFRIDQESEAYAKQYAFICVKVKDRNQRHGVLWNLASMLGGPMYGLVISHDAAMKMIREKSNVK